MKERTRDLSYSQSDPECFCDDCKNIRSLESELKSAWTIIEAQRERIKQLINEANAVSFQEQRP